MISDFYDIIMYYFDSYSIYIALNIAQMQKIYEKTVELFLE